MIMITIINIIIITYAKICLYINFICNNVIITYAYAKTLECEYFKKKNERLFFSVKFWK